MQNSPPISDEIKETVSRLAAEALVASAVLDTETRNKALARLFEEFGTYLAGAFLVWCRVAEKSAHRLLPAADVDELLDEVAKSDGDPRFDWASRMFGAHRREDLDQIDDLITELNWMDADQATREVYALLGVCTSVIVTSWRFRGPCGV